MRILLIPQYLDGRDADYRPEVAEYAHALAVVEATSYESSILGKTQHGYTPKIYDRGEIIGKGSQQRTYAAAVQMLLWMVERRLDNSAKRAGRPRKTRITRRPASRALCSPDARRIEA